MSMGDPIEAFREAIAAVGLTPPDTITADGGLHRFPTSGRRGDDSGWYVLHTDGIPAGAFGCWRSGMHSDWCGTSKEAMTESERQAHRQRIEAMRAQRETEQAARHHQAAAEASRRWDAATPATDHPYLTSKGVKPYGLRAGGPDGEALLVPMRDAGGVLCSLQVIDPAGGKRFHPGGRVKGCYHAMGKLQAPDATLIVCEGYATGASIREATGHAVAVAFNAGNLEAVALALHTKYPRARLIVAADDDHRTDGNPGKAKAIQAAAAVGAVVAVPVFPDCRGDKDTDFNDLHRMAGADAVRVCIAAAAVGAVVAVQTWADPVPLPDDLPPVDAFDAELLPQSLRPWVLDIAHRMQCPPDFPAVGAVVALSSLIGARAVVHPKERDEWAVVPNLWGMIVGRPGVMKSPALTQAMAPLTRLEAAERESWQQAHDEWELDCKVSDLASKDNEKRAAKEAAKNPAAARELLRQSAPPDEPIMRRYVVNDTSVEKLGDTLTVNPWGLLVFRDELHGLISGMDRQGQEGARGFYLTGYDGNQGYAVDRIGRGESYIPRVCLAMLGGIQPGKLQSYVRDAVNGGAGDDGLLQRFGMAVWPDVAHQWQRVDQWPDTPAKQAAWAVFERLSAMQPATDTDPHVWRFSAEAQSIYWEWAQPFETELRGDDLHPALVSHLAKYRKLIPALALIFALVDTPDSGGVIHEAELLRALEWGDYLRSHAQRIYAAAFTPDTAGAAALLAKIKAGALREEFTARTVAVKHWAGLGTPDDVRKAADMLADHGYLDREPVPAGSNGGRPSVRYSIHPAMLKGGA